MGDLGGDLDRELDERLGRELDHILDELGCSTGTIHGVDAGGALVLLAHRGLPPELLPRIDRIPVGKGMAGIAAERREPVQLCNLQTDDTGVARPAARATSVAGSIAVPMLADGALRGTLGIGKRAPYQFTY